MEEEEIITYKDFDITDLGLVEDLMNKLQELSYKFKKIADDVILNEKYYNEKGVEDCVAERQNCFAVHYALNSATSSLCNIYNVAGMLDCNKRKIGADC